MKLTQEQLVELISQSLPYSEQITNWDFSEEGAVRFQWRSSIYRVSKNLFVEEKESIFLKGSDITIILEALLKRVYLEKEALEIKKEVT